MELILHEKPKRPTIIEGFPGVGYVGTITVEYMINHLDAKPIGLIFDENIPPVAMLYKDQTRRLMEIYYAKKENIVFIHAITGIKGMEWDVADTILELAKTLNAKEIISLEGVVSPIDDQLSRVFVRSNDPKSEKEFILSNKELLSNRNRWHKNLKKDIFISEGVNVLEQIFSNKSSSEMILAIKE